MMNYDEQIKKLETSFYTFIFEEESNKKLKKNDVEKKAILDSWYFFTERQLAFFSKYDFCYMKQGIPSLLWGFFKSNIFFIFSFIFWQFLLLKMYVYFVVKSDEYFILLFQTTLSTIFVGCLWSLNANFDLVRSLQLANDCV